MPGPLSSPGYIKRCQLLPSSRGTARLGSSQLSGTSARGCRGARSKTWSHSECATIGLGQKTILRQELTFHNPCESPRSGETKLERKRTKRMVGVRGFEPPTPASRTQYSTRLSYTPNQLFSTLIFVTRNLASTSQARGQQLYAGRDIRAI
jgi:hypothetical protein